MHEFDPRHFTFSRNSGIPRGSLYAADAARLRRWRNLVLGIAGVCAFWGLFFLSLLLV